MPCPSHPLLIVTVRENLIPSLEIILNRLHRFIEITLLVWNPKVHYRVHKSHKVLPSVQVRGLV
jgi:hypothetical protein